MDELQVQGHGRPRGARAAWADVDRERSRADAAERRASELLRELDECRRQHVLDLAEARQEQQDELRRVRLGLARMVVECGVDLHDLAAAAVGAEFDEDSPPVNVVQRDRFAERAAEQQGGAS